MMSPPDIAPPMAPPGGAVGDLPAPVPAMPVAAYRVPTFVAVLRATWMKESRELAPWCVGTVAAFCGILSLFLYATARQVEMQTVMFPLTDRTYFASAALCPGIAALFGLMQFLPETTPGRIALLLHRPPPRAWLFLAKMCVGLSLYLAVVGIPLFAMLWWISDPHHVPYPFFWSMSLPFVADMATGIPAYAAGALIGFRHDGRWHLPHILPVALILVCGILNHSAWSLGWSLLYSFVATVFVLSAAVGVFSAARIYRQQRPLSKFALGVVQYVSLCFVATILLLTLRSGYRSITEYQPMSMAVRREFRGDEPYVKVMRGGEGVSEVMYGYTKDLKLVPRDTGGLNTISWMMDRTTWSAMFSFRDEYAYAWPWFGRYSARWFVPDGGNYLVGYHNGRRELLGSLGPGGFFPGRKVPPERFDGPLILAGSLPSKEVGDFAYLFAAGDSLWEFAPGDRQGEAVRVTRTFTMPGHETIISAAMLRERSANPNESGPPTTIAVVTREKIYFLTPTSTPEVMASYSDPQLNMSNINLDYFPEDKEFLIESPRGPRTQWSSEVEDVLVYLRADGSKQVVILPPVPMASYDADAPLVERLVFAAAAPAPLGVAQALLAIQPESALRARASVVRRGEPAWMEMQLSLVVSVLCGVLAWVFGGASFFSTRARVAWALGVVLLGIPGLVLLLITRGIPLKVRCPACGNKRRADQAVCPHCAASFPQAALNGTEIFA